MGGRNLSPLLCAMNAGASDMSSWLMMGLPGAFYLYGMNQIWIIIGLVTGSWFSWKLVAKRLRIATEQLGDALTIPTFLERRFSDNTGILRVVSSIIIIIFFTVYIASCLVGGAKLFSEIFNTNYTNALFFSCILIVGYACIGGFMAISWGDLVQGSLMLLGILIVPYLMITDMASRIDIWQILQSKSGYLNPINLTFIEILSSLAWGLGYFGQPHIISKYMAIKNPQDLSLSRLICTTWMSVAMAGAALVGLLASVFFMDKELKVIENVFILASYLLAHPFIFGVILTAVLAAIMSTINGQLIICSSLLVEDFYKKYFRKNATQKEYIMASRLSILLVIAISLVIANDKNNSILWLVAHAWAGLGASLGPVILFSLYSKTISKNAAIAGIISGGLSSIFFANYKIFPYELLPAFIISCSVIFIIKKRS